MDGAKIFQWTRAILGKEIKIMLVDKTIMVTGAGGSIGSELCHQVAKFSPKKIICFEQSEYNLYKLEREINALRYIGMIII